MVELIMLVSCSGVVIADSILRSHNKIQGL